MKKFIFITLIALFSVLSFSAQAQMSYKKAPRSVTILGFSDKVPVMPKYHKTKKNKKIQATKKSGKKMKKHYAKKRINKRVPKPSGHLCAAYQ